MVNGASKGSGFERQICRLLSMWWMEGTRDDIFWRTRGSGGMATRRASQGKHTANQQGDMLWSDPLGQPLLNLCTFEMKTGYGTWSFLDQIDRGANMKERSILSEFLAQTEESRKQAGTKWGILIAKRDKRVPVIVYPQTLNTCLIYVFGRYASANGQMGVFCGGRLSGLKETYICARLTNWLEWIHPDFFKLKLWEGEMGNREKAPAEPSVGSDEWKKRYQTSAESAGQVAPRRRRRSLI